jgi:hypothetical protein
VRTDSLVFQNRYCASARNVSRNNSIPTKKTPIMAKRRSIPTIQDNTPDYLVKPKKIFEGDLAERIRIGEELLNRQVNNQKENGQLYSDYNFWHDFNSEFLKRAFNKTNSQYYQDYTSTPMMYVASIIPHTPSLREQIDETKSDISKHLTRLKKIKEKLVLIDELPGLSSVQDDTQIDKQTEGLNYLEKIFSKYHKVAQSLRYRHASRETLTIKDEYDVQDLLRGLLQIHFTDIREEDYSPSYAGGNSRIDFVLKDEKIVVETKMTNDHLKDKEIGSQLLIDIGRYRAHPDCKLLVVFIYDKGDHIRNKAGMINDLEKMTSHNVKVRVFIEPR